MFLIEQHLSNVSQLTCIQFIDNMRSFLGNRFFIEYYFIRDNLISTTSCSNYSIDIVGVDVIPTRPDTISLYIADANSFTIIFKRIKGRQRVPYLPQLIGLLLNIIYYATVMSRAVSRSVLNVVARELRTKNTCLVTEVSD